MVKRPVKSVCCHPRWELHILFAMSGQDIIPHYDNGLIEVLATPPMFNLQSSLPMEEGKPLSCHP